MLKKRLLSAVVALGIVMSSSVQVLAEPLTDAKKAEMEQQKIQLQDSQDKLSQLEATLQSMDNDIEKTLGEIDTNNKNIANAETQIKKLQADIEKAKKELQEKQELFDTRMRAIYKSGSPGYVEMIIKSESFSDLISKVKAVGKLMDFDKKIIDELDAKKKELDSKKTSLDNEVQLLNNLKAENEKKLAELNSKKQEQKKLVDQAKEENKKLKGNLGDNERQMISFQKNIINNPNSSSDDIQSAIAALREMRKNIVVIESEVVDLIEKGKTTIKNREASAYVPSRGGGAVASSNSIVNYASRFMGVKYVWGGTTPAGFDCSGFTSYVYRAFGYEIGRATYNQIGSGVSVSYADLQPGDLVFTNGVNHVGIYVGGGQYIHAPHTGDVVKISPIYGFSSARRIIR